MFSVVFLIRVFNKHMSSNREKLDQLLFKQGGRCFYCGRSLNRSDASVDHVQPRSMSGRADDSNEVACCKTINSLFGNSPAKTKIAALLLWGLNPPCPDGLLHQLSRQDAVLEL